MLRFIFLAGVIFSSFLSLDASAHAGHNSDRGLLILQQFPTSPEDYAPAAAQLVREGVIEKWGHEEWVAVVMSHEMHQHIGIYTILGAKMGVYAREALEANTRTVSVTLLSEGQKAMSCAADGIQVALGSTFGQGLIQLAAPEAEGFPLQALFQQGEKRLTLTLKPEYQRQVEAIIAAAAEEHRFLSPAYFEALAAASYRIWAEFDRHEIFLDQRSLVSAEEDASETSKEKSEERNSP